jgi:RNA polymerase sigma-70 factor (ECF subfamily)
VTGADLAAPTPERLDDAQLVEAIKTGDARRAGAFHDRTRPVIERTVHRLLGSSDSDFDDLVQVAMIELIRSLGRFRGECSLDTWTTTVASNLVYKHLRRRGLERSLFAREPPEDLPHSTHQQPVLRGLVDRVSEHLQQLSPDRAWAFLFHDVYGYSLEEIAAMTGVTVAAAQSRLVRGRKELHERIANDPELANGIDSVEGTT